jgi:carbon-monoxide dehydrogenase medium subunit
MYAFDYLRPRSVDEALAALRADTEAKLLAGGMTLLPTMKLRLARPSCLIDLNCLAGLSGARIEGEEIVIGALTRHADVAASELVRARLPALAALAAEIGDAQVRHRGTLGGSLANHDPAADYPAAALALGATVVTNARRIAADDFFTGMFETALAADEIVTAVHFPLARRAAYAKFPQPASRYAMAGVFVAAVADGVRVAVTGAGPGVFRVPAMEAALARKFAPAALVGIDIDVDGLNDDLHASSTYRAHLVGVMAARAVQAAS